MLVLNFIVFFLSLLILDYTAKLSIDKAVRLSIFFGISRFAMGVIFIATITSLPEFSIAVTSSSAGMGNLSLGDLLGSNVTNISLLLGIMVLLHKKDTIKIKSDINNVLITLLPLFSLPLLLDSSLTTFESILLLFFFGLFVYIIYKEKMKEKYERISITKKEAAVDFLVFVFSIVVLMVCARAVVDSAVRICIELGIYFEIMGATIVALGTSLPELAITVAGARKGESEISLGNLIGSNVVNLTLILGINGLINPLNVPISVIGVVLFFVVLTALFVSYCIGKSRITRNDGLLLIFIYGIYLLSTIIIPSLFN